MNIFKKSLVFFLIFSFFFNNISVFAYGRFLPGTYKGGYDWLKTEVLKDFFINILDQSESILDGLDTGGNDSVYNSLFNDTLLYLNNNLDERNQKAKSLLLKNRGMLMKYINGIHGMETNNNLSINPRNHQGLFQLYYLESDNIQCNSDRRNRYTTCKEIESGLYKPLKEISHKELVLEFLDFVYFWNDKFGNLKYYINNNSSKINMKMNLSKWFEDIGLESNIDEINEFYNLYLKGNKSNDFYTSEIIKNFYLKNNNLLSTLGFKNYGDLYLLNEFYEIGLIGSLYNGLGNVGKYVLDNAYISNNPKLGFTFTKCSNDGCSLTTTSQQIGLMYNVLRYSKNEDFRKGYIIYSLIMKRIYENLEKI